MIAVGVKQTSIVVILLTLALTSCERLVEEEEVPAVPQPLSLDGLYDRLLPWIAQLYDPESGGFYESLGVKQGKEDRDYPPDIQSTYFVIQILSDVGLLSQAPEGVRQKLIHFFQSRQDANTGFFLDSGYPEMVGNPRVMGRALHFSTSALRYLKAPPLYPLPGERGVSSQSSNAEGARFVPVVNSAKSSLPEHITSRERFYEWLEGRPWTNSWTALDQLQSQARLIKGLPEQQREELTDEAMGFLATKQDPATGFIGDGSSAVKISGAFKLAVFCDTLGRPVPSVLQLKKSVIEWLLTQPETDKIFFIRNAIELLEILLKQTGQSISPEELDAVFAAAIVELKRFRQPDGGFSSFSDEFYITPNDLYISPRRQASVGPQGDMNGTSSAWALRKALYKLADEVPLSLEFPDFWERCR